MLNFDEINKVPNTPWWNIGCVPPPQFRVGDKVRLKYAASDTPHFVAVTKVGSDWIQGDCACGDAQDLRWLFSDIVLVEAAPDVDQTFRVGATVRFKKGNGTYKAGETFLITSVSVDGRWARIGGDSFGYDYRWVEVVEQPKFKVGDKVRCINPSDPFGLFWGDVFTVASIDGRGWLSLEGQDNHFWMPDRFEPAADRADGLEALFYGDDFSEDEDADLDDLLNNEYVRFNGEFVELIAAHDEDSDDVRVWVRNGLGSDLIVDIDDISAP